MLDLSRGQPWARWCVGGTTNIVLNCIDKHRGTPVWDQTFLVWEGEDKHEQRTLTYREFAADVDRLARALLKLGIGRGDVVAIYMPNLPETFAAFFAILKIGAIVMPLFSGFGPSPIQSRLNHGDAKAVITANGTWRRGVPAPLKSVLDEALKGSPSVQHVIVADRRGLGIDTPMRAGRDHWWHDVVPGDDAGRRNAGDAGRGSRHPALYVGNDRRAQGLRLDPYRLHRLDGDARRHHLRRLQAFGPLFLLQRHGMDGRRDVRLHPEFCRRQPSDRGRHARLSRYRPLLAPDRGPQGQLSRRVADDRPQPDALRRRGRELRSLQPADYNLRRRSLDRDAVALVLRACLQAEGFRSSISRAAPKSAAASSPAHRTIR